MVQGIFRFARPSTDTAPVWTTSTTLPIVHAQSINLNTLCSDIAQGLPLSYSNGPLPTGITLTGAVLTSNLTATVGSVPITLTATNTRGLSSPKVFQLVVSAVPMDINALTINITIAPGSSVNLDQYRNGGIGSFSYAQSAGQAFALGGLTLNANGVLNAAITAIVQTTGGYRVTVTDAQNTSAQSPVGGFSITVSAAGGPFAWNQAAFNALPVSMVGPYAGLPRVRFTEGVSSFVFVDTWVTGNPAILDINRQPNVEAALAGINFRLVTGRLALFYDGSPGIGAVGKFQLGASSGERLVFDNIIPYAGLKVFDGDHSGVKYITGVSAHLDGAGSEGLDHNIPLSSLNSAAYVNFENLKGDVWDNAGNLLAITSAATPWHSVSVTTGQSDTTVPVNITTMWKAWEKGDYQNYGLFLKCPGGCSFWRKVSTVNNMKFQILWSNGQTITYDATSEVKISTSQGFGVYPPTNPSMSSDASGEFPIVYLDPTTLPQNLRAVTVTLLLSVHTVQSNGAIQIFPVAWRGQDILDPIVDGFSSNYTNDAGIENDANVISYQDWGVSGAPNIYGPNNILAYLNTPSLPIKRGAGWQVYSGASASVYDPETVSGATRAIIGAAEDPSALLGTAAAANYVPLRPGMRSFRIFIPGQAESLLGQNLPISGGNNDYSVGGYSAFFYPYSLLGTDPQELFIRYYTRISSRWKKCPIIGGHTDGFGARYNAPARTDICAQTGLRFASPAWLNATNTLDYWYAQTELNALEDFLGINSVAAQIQPPTSVPAGYTAWSGPFDTKTNPIYTLGLRGMQGYSYWRASQDSYSLPPSDPRYGTDETQTGWHFKKHCRGIFPKDTWVPIEHHVKMNTIGAWDGVWDVHIGGREAFSRNNIRFRNNAITGITSFFFERYSPSKSGGHGTSYYDQVGYVSPVVVATARIGPGHITP